jgi:hypothetical protein
VSQEIFIAAHSPSFGVQTTPYYSLQTENRENGVPIVNEIAFVIAR